LAHGAVHQTRRDSAVKRYVKVSIVNEQHKTTQVLTTFAILHSWLTGESLITLSNTRETTCSIAGPTPALGK
jgi:hypothetical protein